MALNASTTMNCASSTGSQSTLEQQSNPENSSSMVVVLPSDDMMDLLRAIEMSRLQAVRENEQNIYRPHLNSQINAAITSNDKIDYFNDLQQAIELSLTTHNQKPSTIENLGSLDLQRFAFLHSSHYFLETEDTDSGASQIMDASTIVENLPSLDLFGM